MKIWDTSVSYGTVTRALHWGIAVLLVWQFSGMISKVSLGRDHDLTKLLSGNHGQIGTVLFVLIALRLIWAFINRNRRPTAQPGLAGYAARLGHAAMYAIMFLVPFAALMRAWGGERAFAPFGFEIFAARAPENVVTAAVEFGNNLHGEFAWVLGLLILGHIVMALFHHFILRDGLLKRIAA